MIAKEAQHQQEQAIHSSRHEGGVRAMFDWLMDQQAEINRKWMHATGDELLCMQGEAKRVAKMISVIKDGPRINNKIGGDNG